VADIVDITAKDKTIGPGKVDEFEYAGAERPFLEGLEGFDAASRNPNHFARLNLPYILPFDNIEGARLRSDQIGSIKLAQTQRTKPVRISDREELVLIHDEGAVGPFAFGKRGRDAIREFPFGLSRYQVDDDFAVGSALKNTSGLFQSEAKFLGVDHVSVESEGDLTLGIVSDERLGVANLAGTGGRIADMPNSPFTGKSVHDLLAEDIRDQSHPNVAIKGVFVRGANTRALLAPMLEAVEAQIG
jgi:hypothetical protein